MPTVLAYRACSSRRDKARDPSQFQGPFLWLLAYAGGFSDAGSVPAAEARLPPGDTVGDRALALLRTAPAGSHQGKRLKEKNLGESVTQREGNVEKLAHPRAHTRSSEQLQPHPSGSAREQPREAAARRAHRGQPVSASPRPPARRAAREVRPPHRARPGRPGRAPDSAKGFDVPEHPPELASHACHRGAGKVPGCRLRRPQPGLAHSERRRAGPAGRLPGSKSANSGCGRMRGAISGGSRVPAAPEPHSPPPPPPASAPSTSTAAHSGRARISSAAAAAPAPQ